MLHVDQGLPGLFGIFIWSASPNELPFQGATLCLGTPIIRGGPVLMTGPSACDASGSYPLSQADLAASMGNVPFVNVYAQFWYRDNANPPFNIGLSDALEFVLLP